MNISSANIYSSDISSLGFYLSVISSISHVRSPLLLFKKCNEHYRGTFRDGIFIKYNYMTYCEYVVYSMRGSRFSFYTMPKMSYISPIFTDVVIYTRNFYSQMITDMDANSIKLGSYKYGINIDRPNMCYHRLYWFVHWRFYGEDAAPG